MPRPAKRNDLIDLAMRLFNRHGYHATGVDRLMQETLRATGLKTKREVVELALRRLVASARQKDILDLVGQDLIAPDYDVRAARSGSGTRRGVRGVSAAR